ncbi:hypothetical protein D0X99_10355 [Algoriphagus lacus]|uniref:Uncharacterized protein n=1 Tax=Algoriphagus lacus TaxID=2056311 RepID=A0A418PSG1_9BACT|nr:hypothetical protein D0X99_10355 [Algoriphagus lacus]
MDFNLTIRRSHQFFDNKAFPKRSNFRYRSAKKDNHQFLIKSHETEIFRSALPQPHEGPFSHAGKGQEIQTKG